jgi:glutathione peroxidase
MPRLIDFSAASLHGAEIPLSTYDNQVVLVVNTASKCGMTPQYEGLEQLYRTYRDQGLVVLGFPCDQFGNQEPGSEAEIADFCDLNYGVSFPMFAKIEVNGKDAHPLFAWLKDERRGILGGTIKWNFTKFLINRQGEVVDRFAPTTTPDKIEPEIKAALALG